MLTNTTLTQVGPRPGLAPAKTSKAAIASLVLGVLGFVSAGLTGIPGVICGHVALGKIKKSGGALGGKGLAIAGLITSYLATMIILLAALATPAILKSIKEGRTMQAMSNGRNTYMLLMQFEYLMGSFPSDQTAAKLRPEHPTLNLTGTSSNAYFRQLLASGVATRSGFFTRPAAEVAVPTTSLRGPMRWPRASVALPTSRSTAQPNPWGGQCS